MKVCSRLLLTHCRTSGLANVRKNEFAIVRVGLGWDTGDARLRWASLWVTMRLVLAEEVE